MTKEEIDSPTDSEEDVENLLTPAKVANHSLKSMAIPTYDCTLMTEWNTYHELYSKPGQPDNTASLLMDFMKHFCSIPLSHDIAKLTNFVMVFGKYKVITAVEICPILEYINMLFIKK